MGVVLEPALAIVAVVVVCACRLSVLLAEALRRRVEGRRRGVDVDVGVWLPELEVRVCADRKLSVDFL